MILGLGEVGHIILGLGEVGDMSLRLGEVGDMLTPECPLFFAMARGDQGKKERYH